ncbi:MAG TPA: mannosyltransferase family protein [Solirubrobacteraceae bacterium]|nr:mannosyltransferase family protein [Solirubrobacteraceae bacterium]
MSTESIKLPVEPAPQAVGNHAERPTLGRRGGLGASRSWPTLRPRRQARLASLLGSLDIEALRDLLPGFLLSRALVFAAGWGAVLAFGFGPARKVFQHAQLTRGFGALGNVLLAPVARWDAAWYLLIAHAGYAPALGSATIARSAFFPLYPLAIRALSLLALPPALAGAFVSLAAFAIGLYLLHRLTRLEMSRLRAAGRRVGEPRSVARLAVVMTALSPMAFFFSADYSESLYLALSLAVFWYARRGAWARAGLLGALASATRPTGVLLVIPAALLYLYGPREQGMPAQRAPLRTALAPRLRALLERSRPRYRLSGDAAYIALIPAGVLAFMAYLALAGGSASAPFSAEALWGREFAGPFVALWSATVAAFDGVRQLLSMQSHHSYLAGVTGSPLVAASHNIPLFAAALLTIALCVALARTLPIAYIAYVATALALPLSYPVAGEPLMSLPRFLIVLFPLAIAAAVWLERNARARRLLLPSSALLMVFFTAAFATWHWVA